MIIKKDINLGTFAALVNFINGPQSILTKTEAGGRIFEMKGTSRHEMYQKRVIRLKGNTQVKEEGELFGVTVEIDDRVSVEGQGTKHLPEHFLSDLMKVLGTPLK